MILEADGFTGVFLEHKYKVIKMLQGLGHLCAMTGDGANDVSILSKANFSIVVKGVMDAACGAVDIMPTGPGLLMVMHTICQSHIIFQHMHNYSIYMCTVTIHIVMCSIILSFAYKFNFPLFMVLSIVLPNESMIMMLSIDHVFTPTVPYSWDLTAHLWSIPDPFTYVLVLYMILTHM